MKKIIIAIVMALSATLTTMAETKEVTIKIVETSDVHGAFFPAADRPSSMAKVASRIKALRTEYGEQNVIVLDNGDILQGQPVNYYYNFVATDSTQVVAAITNALHYDAQTYGNHDIEAGHAVYDKWVSESHCPTICANIINTATGKTYAQPYIIFERQGVKIAVIGMLTPAIPNWLTEDLWQGMAFEEMTKSARHWLEVVEEKEQPDVIIGLFHSGWEGGIVTPDYAENATRAVAEQVPGYDIIFFGHDHMERCISVENEGGQTLCLNPANNARNTAEASISILIDKDGCASVKNITGQVVNVTNLEDDEDYLNTFQGAMKAVQTFVTREVGVVADTLATQECFFGSAPFVDLIHNTQLTLTGADISFNAPLSANAIIPKGVVTVEDMFKLYKYENKVVVMAMTGAEVRRHLEMSYDQWVNTMTSPDDHIMRITEETRGDNHRAGFANMTFNFDSAAGIDYVVDVTKPDGQKVKILSMSDGRPFDESATYRVVMNSYRAAGGGELLTRGAGIAKDSLESRVVWRSERDLRHYLMEVIERAGTITPKALDNWHFIPQEWTEPAIARDRKLLFK